MRLARRDLRRRAELRRRVPRAGGRRRRGGKLARAAVLEHDETRQARHLARPPAPDSCDQRNGPALARLGGDILDADHAAGPWGADVSLNWNSVVWSRRLEIAINNGG